MVSGESIVELSAKLGKRDPKFRKVKTGPASSHLGESGSARPPIFGRDFCFCLSTCLVARASCATGEFSRLAWLFD